MKSFQIREQIKEHQIEIFRFNKDEEDLVPFAVVGSNAVIVDENGKKTRGRKYPWGVVNIEDKEHCDFLALRSLVLAKHMQHLKDETCQKLFEKYRGEKLLLISHKNEVN